MVVMVTGPSFSNINWGTYIGDYWLFISVQELTHVPVCSICWVECLYYPRCVSVLSRDSRTFARRCDFDQTPLVGTEY